MTTRRASAELPRKQIGTNQLSPRGPSRSTTHRFRLRNHSLSTRQTVSARNRGESEHSRSWCRVTDSADDGGIALGGGIENVAEGTIKDFASAALDRYIAYLAAVSKYAAVYLHEEDLDIRVHVWNLAEVPVRPRFSARV